MILYLRRNNEAASLIGRYDEPLLARARAFLFHNTVTNWQGRDAAGDAFSEEPCIRDVLKSAVPCHRWRITIATSHVEIYIHDTERCSVNEITRKHTRTCPYTRTHAS